MEFKTKSIFKPNVNTLRNTFCVFYEVSMESIKQQPINYKSKSGSKYIYTEKGMYRISNHWGRLANSKWRLVPLNPETNSKLKVGFANWDDFYPDNANQKLYYLEVDFKQKTVLYQHKNNPLYDKKPILRTTKETTKRIKQIRNLFELTSWAKHFKYENLDDLRVKIIERLIFTDENLEVIKRDFL